MRPLRRHGLVAALLFIATLTAVPPAAQSKEAQKPKAKEESVSNGIVERPSWGKVVGWVLDAQTHQPVSGARISVEVDGAFPESGKTNRDTDAKGRFEAQAPLGKISSKVDWSRLLGMHPVSMLLGPFNLRKITKIVDVTQVNVRAEADGYQPFVGRVQARHLDANRFAITLADIWLAPKESKLTSFTPERLQLEAIESLTVEPAIASPGEKVKITLAARLPVDRGYKYRAYLTSSALRLIKDQQELKRDEKKGAAKKDEAAPLDGESTPRVVFTHEATLPKVSQDRSAELGFVLTRNGDTELRQRDTKALLQVVRTAEERAAAEKVAEGWAAARRGDNDAALQSYAAARRLSPSYILPHLLYGDLCLTLGRPADAVTAFKALVDLDPHDYEVARTRYARALVEAGKPREALETLSGADKALGKHIPARVYLYRARAEAALGNYPEADKLLAKAGQKIEFSPEAVTQINLNRMKDAVAAKPQSPDLRLSYARVLADAQRREEAIAQIRKATELEPQQPWAFIDLAEHLRDLDRRDEALANIRHALSLQPDNPEGLLVLGDLLRDEGKYTEALPVYEKVTVAQKLNLRARHNYALMLYATGKLTEARRELGEVIAQARDKGDIKEKGLMIPGAAIYWGPKRQLVAGFSVPEAAEDMVILEAIQDLEKHPDSGLLWQNIGGALVDLDLPRLAVETLEKARKLDPTLLETRFFLAMARRKLGDLSGAESELKAVLTANPLHPRARLELAQLYTDRGDVDQAQAQLAAHSKNWPHERPVRPSTAALGG